MAFYDGLFFFIVLGIVCIPAVFLGIWEKDRKNYILFLSLIFAFWVFRGTGIEFVYFIAYLFLEWHLIAIYQWSLRRFGKSRSIYVHFLIFSILPLATAKSSILIGHHWFAFVGISYITFRVVQIIIESYDGLIEKSSFADTISFLIFFPSFSSGPIDRSRRFEKDIHRIYKRQEYLDILGAGLWKILLGILYKFVLSDIAFTFLSSLKCSNRAVYLVLYAYLYGFYMFFDFAGYSLMAIGTAYVLGIRLPDNFNRPFISVDMKEFWDRWHISLSHWLRDFLFSRFMMNAIKGRWFKERLSAASAGFLVNMLVMGIWHGLTEDYILYGLYHGILLALTEKYQKKSKFHKKYKQKLWYRCISWAVTLNLVMFGFLIFSGKFLESI